jgi:hypothetical protein
MKKTISIGLLSILVFIILSLTTAKWETIVDGNDTVGFPMTFYIKFSNMCFDCPTKPTEFNYINLTIDLIFAGLLGLAIFIGIDKIIRLKNRKKNAT